MRLVRELYEITKQSPSCPVTWEWLTLCGSSVSSSHSCSLWFLTLNIDFGLWRSNWWSGGSNVALNFALSCGPLHLCSS